MDVANRRGALGEKDAKALSEFSGTLSNTLKTWKEDDIKKKQLEGKRLAQKADEEKYLALANQVSAVKQEDTELYHGTLKANMLAQGADYSEADRIAKLSPWQQVGYVKEKLRQWNESLPDKLDHFMANSQLPMEIGGVEFTPEGIHGDPLALPFKQAAIHVGVNKIAQNAGIFNYSDELLELAGTRDVIQSAKEGVLNKYRDRYNIDASNRTRMQAIKEWNSLKIKNGRSLGRLLTIMSNTVGENGKLLGNVGAWTQVTNLLKSEVLSGNLSEEELEAIENEVIPEYIRRRIGAKPGTTYGQQWGGRFAQLRSDIRKGEIQQIDDALKAAEMAGKELKLVFLDAHKKHFEKTGEVLDTKTLNLWKRRWTEHTGQAVPQWLKGYETASLRNQREDELTLSRLVGSEHGYITHAMLDRFHPAAAEKYRKDADRFEDKYKSKHEVKKEIEASINATMDGMGLTTTEKSGPHVTARKNAMRDWEVKFNRLVAMGYDADHAAHLALWAKKGEIPHEGEENFEGIMIDLEKGKTSKYIKVGQAYESTLGAENVRVGKVIAGKKAILANPEIIRNGTIGGDYGKKQLQVIINNLHAFGPNGYMKDSNAWLYYQGLTRGKAGHKAGLTTVGLIDKQLKAVGHPGLFAEGTPPLINLMENTNDKGEELTDEEGLQPVANNVRGALTFPTTESVSYATLAMIDATDYINKGSTQSIWDQDWNLPNYLVKVTPRRGFV